MNKIWKFSESKSDKIILVNDKTIYKGNLSSEKIAKLGLSAEIPKSIKHELFGIPYNYIKKVINQKDVKYIKIFFGNDSEEELNVVNENDKNEIFDFIKSDITELKYKSELPSFFSYCKTQLFALLILTGIFIWSMYYAVEISNGTEFVVSSEGRPGLGTMVFGLANIGIPKLVMGYAIFISVTFYSLFKKIKSRSLIQVLYR